MKDPHQDEMIGRKCCGSERRMGIKTHMLEIMASLAPPDKRFNYRHLRSVSGTPTQVRPPDRVKEISIESCMIGKLIPHTAAILGFH
jgi:hypothetical protein